MIRLGVVWMEMLWPLGEGAAVPLCVRTVDQGAPDGGYVRAPFSSSGLRPHTVLLDGVARMPGGCL
jgi:hypothetical protein